MKETLRNIVSVLLGLSIVALFGVLIVSLITGQSAQSLLASVTNRTSTSMSTSTSVSRDGSLTTASTDDSSDEDVYIEGTDYFLDWTEMNFYINGQKLTLGTATVQDLIDAGVTFTESSTEDLEGEVESHSYLSLYTSHNDRSISFFCNNIKTEAVPATEAYILSVTTDAYTIYGQVNDFITFDYDFWAYTEEELVNSLGTPDYSYISSTGAYDYFEYSVPNATTLRYKFYFSYGVLEEVSMYCFIPNEY